MYTAKPRSMTAGARNVLRSNDSASLWNCTLSPGWTDEESETLRKALMKFGIGNWAKIIESSCLPGKTNAQMNLQLQRLLGQQSTAEFASLHIDPKVIGVKNALIQGPTIKRKNNCIVNTGGKLSREELRLKVISNKEEYELPESDWKDIVLPKVADPVVTLELKKQDLKRIEEDLEKVQACILKISTAFPERVEELKLKIKKLSPESNTIKRQIKMQNEELKAETTKEDEDVDMLDEEDSDLIMARALQEEENALAGIIDEDEEEEEDDDFSSSKKRKMNSSSNKKKASSRK
ncbi:unnamed protein product [Mucor hiemalis]